jgi:GNAT superfamily N-acetyltransferase
MNSILTRPISQEDIESFHACLDSIARERKYLGFTSAPSLEETRTSLIEDMERDVIRLVAIDGSKIVGWCQIKSGKWEGYTHMGWLQMGVHKEYRGQGIGTALLRVPPIHVEAAGRVRRVRAHRPVVERRRTVEKENNFAIKCLSKIMLRSAWTI